VDQPSVRGSVACRVRVARPLIRDQSAFGRRSCAVHQSRTDRSENLARARACLKKTIGEPVPYSVGPFNFASFPRPPGLPADVRVFSSRGDSTLSPTNCLIFYHPPPPIRVFLRFQNRPRKTDETKIRARTNDRDDRRAAILPPYVLLFSYFRGSSAVITRPHDHLDKRVNFTNYYRNPRARVDRADRYYISLTTTTTRHAS